LRFRLHGLIKRLPTSNTITAIRDIGWVGELLLNYLALGELHTRLFVGAAGVLMRAWQPDGTVPGPTFLSSEENGCDTFANCYHPTLVGTLFCDGYIYQNTGILGFGAHAAS